LAQAEEKGVTSDEHFSARERQVLHLRVHAQRHSCAGPEADQEIFVRAGKKHAMRVACLASRHKETAQTS